MRFFFRYLSLTAVVLLTTSALLTLTVRAQLLNPDLYKHALKESNIYNVTTSIIENKVTVALVRLQKNIILDITEETNSESKFPIITNIVITALNSLVDNQTGQLVHAVSTNLQVKQGLQSITESAIDRDIAWLRGEAEDPRIFQYIPTPEEILKLQQSSVFGLTGALSSNVLGVDTLPVCITQEQAKENYEYALLGNIGQITCTNNQIQPFVDAAFTSATEGTQLTQTQQELNTTLDVFGIRQLLNDFFQVSLLLSELKQDAISIKSSLSTARDNAYLMLILSLPLLVLGTLLTNTHRIKTIILTYFWTGVLMLFVSIVHYLGAPSLVNMLVPFEQIKFGNTALTNTDGLLIMQSIKTAVSLIVRNVIHTSFIVSTLLTIFTGIVYLLYLVLRRRFAPPPPRSPKGNGHRKRSSIKS